MDRSEWMNPSASFCEFSVYLYIKTLELKGLKATCERNAFFFRNGWHKYLYFHV